MRIGVARLLVTLMIAAALALPVQVARAADAVVGSGTPASCTEAFFDGALDAVLVGGSGTISFNCGGPATITFASQKVIETINGLDPAVTVDGGGTIVLSGGGTTPLFAVNAAPGFPSSLRLRNITLTNGRSAGNGGAIFSTGTVILEGTTIENSVSEAAGGAIMNLDGSLTLINSVVRNNVAASFGGGLNSSGTLTISQSVIQGNRVDGSGGNCNGGGMAAIGTVTISGSQIIANTAASQAGRGGKGGGICFGPGNLTMTQTGVSGNTAVEGGGIAMNGTMDIDDTTLSGNTARRQDGNGGAGGAIWSDGTSLLTDTMVTGNQSFDGGGIYQDRLGSLTLNRTTVAENAATGLGGGGVYVRGDGLRTGNGTGRATISASSIRDNTGQFFGGGIFNNGGNVVISESEVLRNQVTERPPLGFTGGGGVYAANAFMTFERVTLRQNGSPTGGGGLAIGGYFAERQQANNISIDRSSFDGNTAVGGGGAIAVWEDAGVPPFAGSEFNTPVLSINRSTFSGNSSGSNGGAIFNANVVDSNNVTFSGNGAMGSGGAVFSDGRTLPALSSSTYLRYATFVGNRAESSAAALFVNSNALITLRGSVLASSLVSPNCASNAPLDKGGNASSDNSCGLPIVIDAGLGPLANNGGPTLTHLPRADSPLLDRDACQLAFPGDQRDLPRPSGAACDSGAVERQPVPEPAATASGLLAAALLAALARCRTSVSG